MRRNSTQDGSIGRPDGSAPKATDPYAESTTVYHHAKSRLR
jgi:hypothetical protein